MLRLGTTRITTSCITKRFYSADAASEFSSVVHGDGIHVLTFQRPAARNALSISLLGQLKAAVDNARFDRNARVVIIRSGVEGIFCAGADLKERATMNEAQVARFVHDIRSTFSDIATLPVPVIACIDGTAVGGGCELAIACDLRVAGPTVKLGLPETGLAIIPGAGGTQRLPRLIGLSKAKEMIFTGKIVGAQEALKIGLIDHLAEAPKSAFDVSLELAQSIMTKGPIGIRMAKAAINQGFELDLASGLQLEQLCYAQVIPTKDRLEGLKAFREKRSPVYKGE